MLKQPHLKLTLAIFILLCTFLLTFSPRVFAQPTKSLATTIIRVDVNSTALTPNGSSWALAYPNLQDALTASMPTLGDQVEIWVADGIYYPDVGSGYTNNDRMASFVMKERVSLYGGFTGLGGAEETQRSERKWQSNLTILSGDLDQNDPALPTGIVTNTTTITGNNSYSVLRSTNVLSTTILDGFVVTAGNANGSLLDGAHVGGGMNNSNSTMTVANTMFIGNYADSNGGGIYNISRSSPTLNNVTFMYNEAGAFGGGLFSSNFSAPVVTNGYFYWNRASNGAGMYTNGGDPIVTNAIFSGNHSDFDGAGMFNNGSHTTLTNVLFSGNDAGDDGSGLYNNGSSPRLLNVTFAGNNGSGTFSDAAMFNSGSSSLPTIQNSIFWDNRDRSGLNTASSAIGNLFSATPFITNTLVSGSGGSGAGWNATLGMDGGNNIDSNPLFATPIDPFIAPTIAGNFHLQAGSPAINAGTLVNCPSFDLDGLPRPAGLSCDMGVYEYLSIDLTVVLINGGNDALLGWNNTASSSYDLWRSSTPYIGFTIYQSVTSSDYTETDGVMNPAQNYYYYVEDMNASQSNKVGVFTFPIIIAGS